jgi:HAD superfamily hydrolase (TIGR01450 family)
VVCDLDGVIYVGDAPVAGAGDALRTLEEAGFRVVLATNNSTRSPEAVAEHIESLAGYRAATSSIVTSSIAAASLLSPQDSPALIVGEAGLTTALVDAGIRLTTDPDSARAVVVGLARHADYALIRDASRAVRLGARFIATNTDATLPTPLGPVPGAGAIVAAVATAAGCSPEVAGKPHPPMRRAVSQRLGPGPTWVVGDRSETDLAFAAEGGWGRVLVLSGVTSDVDEVPAGLTPDIVVESLADLPPALLRQ